MTHPDDWHPEEYSDDFCSFHSLPDTVESPCWKCGKLDRLRDEQKDDDIFGRDNPYQEYSDE